MKKAVQIVFHRISLRCYSKRQSYKKKIQSFLYCRCRKKDKDKDEKTKDGNQPSFSWRLCFFRKAKDRSQDEGDDKGCPSERENTLTESAVKQLREGMNHALPRPGDDSGGYMAKE